MIPWIAPPCLAPTPSYICRIRNGLGEFISVIKSSQRKRFRRPMGTHQSEVRPPNSRDNTQDALANVYLMLDPQLRPIAPDMSCEESVKIFEQHKQMAQDYLKVETEIALLSRYMDQLAEKLSEEEGLHQFTQQELENYECEIRKLETEKGSLLKLHRNLKRQLEIIKGQHSAPQEGWRVSSSPKGNKQ